MTTAQAVRAGLLVALVLTGLVVALTVDLPSVTVVRGWLADAGAWGWVGLIALSALATLAPVPRTALSVLAGVVAGFWGGLAVAWVSGVLGAAAGYGLARALGRDTVERLAGPRLARADAALSGRGFLATLLGRLTPVAPFTLVSYAAGLSGIRWSAYLAGSALGLLPGTVLHVGIGATVGSTGGGWTLLVSAVPLVVVVVVAVVLTRRRRMQRSTAL